MKLFRYAVLGLGLAAASCAHEKPPVAMAAPPPAPAPAAVPAPTPPPAPAPVAKAQPQSCTSDSQCGASQLCVQSTCTAITAAAAECGISRVHFDFDRSDLHSSDLPRLDRSARCLKASGGHLLITGNADERGPVRYNLALGERRAQAVQTYLVHAGVPATQLEVVTYGKELPVCIAHDEACWSRNRRASLDPNGIAKDISHLIRRDELAEARARQPAAASTARAPAAGGKHPAVQGRHG